MKTGRIVLVTGAAGGMGALVVRRFLENDDTVVAADISGQALSRLQARGRQLHTVSGDVSNEADCARIATLARDRGGRVDVLVNVAGHFPIQPFEETTAEMFRRIIDINLLGVFLMIKAVYPMMKGRGWGRIITFGSASAFEGVPDQAPYVSAKAAVWGLSRSLAKAFGADGITVNVVTPGLTVTAPVKENMSAEVLEDQVLMRAIKRQESPQDVVGAVFFLASPDADFITGQTINVDGGKHML